MAAIRWLPEAWAEVIARAVGALARWALPARRRVAAAQLAAAWPTGSPPVDERAVFRHLARVAWDFVRLPDRHRAGFPEVRETGPVRLGETLSNGGIVIAGHLGSWELVAVALAARVGPRVHVVVKPLGWIDGWVAARRRSMGLYTIRSDQGLASVRRVQRALAAGEVVVFVVDQHAPPDRSAAVCVPFFGRPAWTFTLPAQLADHRRPLVLVTARRGPGAHEVSAVRLRVPEGGADDRRRWTAEAQALLEAAIRAAPDQWLWTHRRWKSVSTRGADPAADGR